MEEFFKKAIEKYGKAKVDQLIKAARSKENFYRNYKDLLKEEERKARINPPITLIYGLPKSGKTAILNELAKQYKTKVLCMDKAGWLANNTSVVELPQHPIKMFEELKVQLSILNTFDEFEIEKLIIDNSSELNEASLYYGTWLFMQTSMGKNLNRTNGKLLPMAEWQLVTDGVLSKGGGWRYPREAIIDLMDNYIRPVSYKMDTIIVGHVKDKEIEENGKKINAKSLNMFGKTADLLMAKVDCPVLFRRKGKKGYFQFQYDDNETVAGSRYDRGDQLIISEMTNEGLKTYWNDFYKTN